MRALYVVGPPGVGKTTALEGAFPALGAPERAGGLMWVEPITDGLRLGRSRESFSGTDALGMAAHPDAVAWAETARMPELVVGEGQRLATDRFFTALAARGELRVVHLIAQPDVLAQRRIGRTQDEAWVKAAGTRAERVAMRWSAITIDSTDVRPEVVSVLLHDLATGVAWSPAGRR